MPIFDDEPNAAVFTTKHVMVGNSPIVHVVHDEDGDWQFFGPEENVQDQDVMIVSLQQVVQRDPTVLELADLPRGAVATRVDQAAPWEVGSAPIQMRDNNS
jgi:hypothetical protein